MSMNTTTETPISVRDRRTLDALSLIVNYFLSPTSQGGLGYKQSSLAEALGVGQSEVSRIKLRQREASPATQGAIAQLLGQDPNVFRANLALFSEGVITFDQLAPQPAVLYPYKEQDGVSLDSLDGDEITKILEGLLPRLDSVRLSMLSAAAAEIVGKRVARETTSPFSVRLLEEMGKAKLAEALGLSAEQVECVDKGIVPQGLRRYQAAVLYHDRMINLSQFPE